MILNLNTSKIVNVKSSYFNNSTTPLEISSVEVISIIDNCVDKVTAAVKYNEFTTKHLVLWSGTTYDNVGNWTQEQANARIIELV